jgi:hypothetical protein
MSRAVLLSVSVILASLAACTAALVVTSAKPAEATFPGRNGFIAFDALPVDDGPYQVFRIKSLFSAHLNDYTVFAYYRQPNARTAVRMKRTQSLRSAYTAPPRTREVRPLPHRS